MFRFYVPKGAARGSRVPFVSPFYGFTTYSDIVKTQVIGNCISSRVIQIFWPALSEFILNTGLIQINSLSNATSSQAKKCGSVVNYGIGRHRGEISS